MIPKFPQFKLLEFSDREEIQKFTNKFSPSSDFNFTSMWCWNIDNKMKVSNLNENLVVYFQDYTTGKPFYSFIGDNKINETIKSLFDLSEMEGIRPQLKLIHNEIHSNIESVSEYRLLPDPDNFDYVYDTKGLAECVGGKYETLRNLINRFKKHSDIKITEISGPLNLIGDHLMELDKKWIDKKSITNNINDFINETKALKRILDIKNDNLLTVCIFEKDKLIAFCISELLNNSDYAISHFAKADVSFPGIYAFLLNQNCKFLVKRNKKYLNYEQDLGLPHLRYSKTSFRPISFIKKHIIEIN